MTGIIQWFNDNPTETLWIQKIFYLIVLAIVVFFTQRFISRLFAIEGKDDRRKTVFPIFKEILAAIIYFLAFCLVLEIFGISTTPIWTIASAVSVAVGFGAQQVIKDIFNGFLILMEGQFEVGDFIEINGISGEVEAITLRTTILRDGVNGSVHIISNGQINVITNYSKKYMIAVVDLPIPFDSDLDYVLDSLHQLGKNYPKSKRLLGPVNVLGVRDFDARNLIIRVICKTRTGDNWAVERDLRRYLKNGLEEYNIYLPHQPVQVKSGRKKVEDALNA